MTRERRRTNFVNTPAAATARCAGTLACMVAAKRRSTREWTAARTLLPIYAEIAPELPPPCCLRDLHDAASDDMLVQVLGWLDAVDAQIGAREFRARLRAAAGGELATALEMALERLIASPPHGAEHVQKVDEACFDYFCVAAPPGFHGRRVSREDVAAVLEPAIHLATLGGGLPRGLDQLTSELEAAASLPALASSDVLRRARELRLADASGCFERMTLIAFTHFNYAAHVTRTRLARGDAEYVLAAETELRARRVVALDCSGAGNGAEPLEQLLARLRLLRDGDAAITAEALRLIAAARLAVEKLRGVAPPAAAAPSRTLAAELSHAGDTTASEKEFGWEPAWLSNAVRPPEPSLFLPEPEALPPITETDTSAQETTIATREVESAPAHAVFSYDTLEEFCARCYPFARSYRLQRRPAQSIA
jgi:hypothetical protein